MHGDRHPPLGDGILDHDIEMLIPRHESGQTSWDSSFSRRNPTIREFMLNSKKSFDSIIRPASLDVSSHPLPLRSEAIVNGPRRASSQTLRLSEEDSSIAKPQLLQRASSFNSLRARVKRIVYSPFLSADVTSSSCKDDQHGSAKVPCSPTPPIGPTKSNSRLIRWCNKVRFKTSFLGSSPSPSPSPSSSLPASAIVPPAPATAAGVLVPDNHLIQRPLNPNGLAAHHCIEPATEVLDMDSPAMTRVSYGLPWSKSEARRLVKQESARYPTRVDLPHPSRTSFVDLPPNAPAPVRFRKASAVHLRSPITPTPATIAKGRASGTDPTGHIGEEQAELSVLTGMADRTDLTMGGFGFEMTESSGSESEWLESTPLGERRIMMTSRDGAARAADIDSSSVDSESDTRSTIFDPQLEWSHRSLNSPSSLHETLRLASLQTLYPHSRRVNARAEAKRQRR